MTDAETLARLRASEMSPGEFLDALEDTQEMPPLVPPPDATEYAVMRDARDRWRFSCVASWGFWALTMLVVFWGNT